MKIKTKEIRRIFPLEFYEGRLIRDTELDCLFKSLGEFKDLIELKALLKEIASIKYSEGFIAGQREIKDKFKQLMN